MSKKNSSGSSKGAGEQSHQEDTALVPGINSVEDQRPLTVEAESTGSSFVVDEDEGDFDDEYDDENATPTLPDFTVSNTNPQLLAFLDNLRTDATVWHALPDWLEEQGDPRAEIIREMAAVQCVVPVVAPLSNGSYPMGCGTWFVIKRHKDSIVGRPYRGTWQYDRFDPILMWGYDKVSLPAKKQTDARLREAFAECRRKLAYMLFDTSEERLRSREVVLTEERIARVVRELTRHSPKVAVPWACELRKIAPERFTRLCQYIRSRPECQEFFVALLNAIHPGWSEQVMMDDS